MQGIGIVLIVLIALAFAAIAYHVVTGTPARAALRRGVGQLICRVFGHYRRRDTVRKVGTHYVGRCTVCGIKLTRDGRDGDWQVASLVPPAANMAETPPAETP